LPGGLNSVPVFNSNSPELVLKEGILLSTFPPEGKDHPEAHLDFPFRGRFDIFAHHIAKADPPENLRTLYWGVLVYNPTSRPVTVDVLQGVSYLSQPDAPFVPLPDWIEDTTATVYAGPGSRLTAELLRGHSQPDLPLQVEIPPGENRVLLSLPIPIKPLKPAINGRSTLVHLRSNGQVYMASLALFAPLTPEGEERSPTLEEWEDVLQAGELVTPRDRVPTPLDSKDSVIYGRVAGVAQGDQWQALLSDPNSTDLMIPNPGSAFSYGISTLHQGRLGTGQIESGEMLVRYPDTAYQAHGNYGVEYNLTLPLYNPTNETQTVTVALETPIKEDKLSQPGLQFFKPLPNQIFFRGLVRINYVDDQGFPDARYVHLVERRGQAADPLVVLKMPPGDRRLVQVDFLYPPDSTPPQVLTVQTLEPQPPPQPQPSPSPESPSPSGKS
jgi:hypothetical protein